MKEIGIIVVLLGIGPFVVYMAGKLWTMGALRAKERFDRDKDNSS